MPKGDENDEPELAPFASLMLGFGAAIGCLAWYSGITDFEIESAEGFAGVLVLSCVFGAILYGLGRLAIATKSRLFNWERQKMTESNTTLSVPSPDEPGRCIGFRNTIIFLAGMFTGAIVVLLVLGRYEFVSGPQGMGVYLCDRVTGKVGLKFPAKGELE